MSDALEIRVHGRPDAPTLVYLPGIHGDWTLITGFRTALADRVRFVEFCYPRTVEWSLADYADAVNRALVDAGIVRGWLLGESFGSQVAWGVWAGAMRESDSGNHFQPEGLVLAGGFVRHPWTWAVRWVRLCIVRAPERALLLFLLLYRLYARLRFYRSPVNLAATHEFLERRRRPGERGAIAHRLDLIADAEFRPLAKSLSKPVFFLTGLWDPIVPWPWVRAWLKCECQALRGERVLAWADHTVLVMQPAKSAEIVWNWIKNSKEPQSRATSSSR